METDSVLLKRYADARDGPAFAELVRRYAAMVYGTCLRLTGDSHLAEDVAQECFLALAREAGAVHSSLPAWLHGTAVNRAKMGIRGESRRRNHEEARGSMSVAREENMGPSWAEVGPHVDEALAELPEELREPLILHFLQQKTQAEIAGDLGVDRSTVSRRIDKGLDELRGRLKKAGVVLTLGALSALLTGNAAQAAPATLVAALGKMAMAGIGGSSTAAGGTAAAGAAAHTGGIAMKAAFATVAGAIVVAGGLVVYSALAQKEGPPAAPSQAADAAQYKLAATVPPVVDCGSLQPGLNVYAAFYCMFQSPDGKTHFIAPFTIATEWHALYVTLDDAEAMLIGGPGHNAARYCYDPARNVMNIGGAYGDRHWYVFDVAAKQLSLLTAQAYGGLNTITMGSDGMMWATGASGEIYSYDLAKKEFKGDWPKPSADQQYIESFGADAKYIYCGCRGKSDAIGRFLVVIERANPAHIMTFNKDQGDASANITCDKNGKYYYFRREGEKSKFQRSNYALPPVDGKLVPLAADPGTDNYAGVHCVFQGARDHSAWEQRYHWEVNLDKHMPIEGVQEYSELKFRKIGDPNWKTVSVPYTGPWGEGGSGLVAGMSGKQVLSIGDYLTVYDYAKKVNTVKGPLYLSPYGLMRDDPTGEMYLLGYSGVALRYDPAKPWTLTESLNSRSYSCTDPKRPNPYDIATVDKRHYCFAADYDAAGLVWLTANTTRVGADFGRLIWYNPVDGKSDTIPALQEILQPGAMMLRNLAATNNRSKICVSGGSSIYVVDAATKSLEHTWPLTPDLFPAIMDAGDDSLLVVQAAVNDATGNLSRVTKLKVSTGEKLFDHPIGVAGWAFGSQSANSKYRYAWRLVKGPDGCGWMFIGDHLYRINPADGAFSKVYDMPAGRLAFNGGDLLIYGGRSLRCITGLLTPAEAPKP